MKSSDKHAPLIMVVLRLISKHIIFFSLALNLFSFVLLIYRKKEMDDKNGSERVYKSKEERAPQSLAKEIGDQGGEGRAYGILGNVYQSLGDHRKAIEYHEKDFKIAKEIGDQRREGIAYGSLGNAYESLGDSQKALEYHEKHLKIAKEIGDQRGEGGAYGSIGNAYESLGDYRKAIDCHEKHLKIAKEIGDQSGEGRADRKSVV